MFIKVIAWLSSSHTIWGIIHGWKSLILQVSCFKFVGAYDQSIETPSKDWGIYMLSKSFINKISQQRWHHLKTLRRQQHKQKGPSDVTWKQCLTCFICFNVTMKIFNTVFSTQTYATCFQSFNLYVYRSRLVCYFPNNWQINKLMEAHTSEWALLVISLSPHPA